MALIYRLLAEACVSKRTVRHVDDISVVKLRAAFESRDGLILIDEGWHSSKTVLSGPKIFGRLRKFAPNIPGVQPLWEFLNISEPAMADCTAILRELSQAPLEPVDKVVVIETLRRIAQLLPEASSQQRSRLRKLPLWSGNRWVENRPVYAFEDINIASQTESQLPVWISGFTSYSGLHDLLDALNVILITPEDFTPVNLSAKSAVGGAPFRYRFNIAA